MTWFSYRHADQQRTTLRHFLRRALRLTPKIITSAFTTRALDAVLRKLRESCKPGEYKIPRGGLFDYVSCANFFGEIFEWGGFALASGSFVAFAFFFNTMFNLVPRALQHHEYYLQKFEDYPKNRRALIPFLI